MTDIYEYYKWEFLKVMPIQFMLNCDEPDIELVTLSLLLDNIIL